MNRKLGLSEPRVRPPDLGLFTALAVLEKKKEDSTYLGPRGAADDARPQGRLAPNLSEVLGQEKAAQRKAFTQTHTTDNKLGLVLGFTSRWSERCAPRANSGASGKLAATWSTSRSTSDDTLYIRGA
jgi:hypothetical protein